MNRIDRLSAILTQLQSKSCVTAAEIAERFGISLRTVYRDIRALEEGGVPIASEAGKGYSLCAGYKLPPIMFTNDEASAFVVAEKLLLNMSDKQTTEAYQSALFKLKSVFHSSDKEFVDSIDQKISVFNIDSTHSNYNNLYLKDIQHALANKKVLKIGYKAKYSGEQSIRNIEPMCLCNYWQSWHLIAYCRLRKAYRDFKLDRTSSLEILDEHYNDDNIIEIEDYFKSLAPETGLHQISVEVDKEIFTEVSQAKYYFGLIDEKSEGDHYILNFAYSNLSHFSKWIIGFGTRIKVIKPAELQEQVITLLRELYKHYDIS